MEYIYILREREFVNSNQNVYKIGRTQDWIKRYRQYPKQTEVLFVIKTIESQRKENDIVNLLKKLTTQRIDIGREYFESDINIIVDKVYSICQESNHNVNKKVQTEVQTTKNEQEIKMMEKEDKNIEYILADVLNTFLKHDFFIERSSEKILRSNFNKLFNQYSEYKFKKMFPSVEINQALRIKGFKEHKTNGDYYFKKISIDMKKFSQCLDIDDTKYQNQIIN